MSYKRIIEKDILVDAQASENYTGDPISMYLGKSLSCQLVSNVMVDTPIDFLSPAKAALTDQSVTYTAVDEGAAGNDITIELIDPEEDSSLEITVTGTAISVVLEYATGSVVTDADALVAALNLDLDVQALIVASGTGNTPLTGLVETNLEGGTDGDIDVDSSTVTIPAHGLVQGALVTLSSDGTLPDPLSDASDYYVIVLTPNTIQFAESAEDAESGVFVELVDSGSIGATNSITPTAIADLTVSLEKSNDGQNWTEIDSESISASGSVFITELSVIDFKYLRVVKALTDGSASIKANLLVIGDAI